MCFIIWLSCIFQSNLKLSSTINNVKFNPCLIMLSVKQASVVHLLLSSGLCLIFFPLQCLQSFLLQLLGCWKSIRKMSTAWDKAQTLNGILLFSSIQPLTMLPSQAYNVFMYCQTTHVLMYHIQKTWFSFQLILIFQNPNCGAITLFLEALIGPQPEVDYNWAILSTWSWSSKSGNLKASRKPWL